QTRFEQGERFEFNLVLIGRALDFLPYFVLSFRELAGEGLGLNRAKCTLEKVEDIGLSSNGAGLDESKSNLVYTAQDQLFRATESSGADEWIATRLRHLADANGNASVER